MATVVVAATALIIHQRLLLLRRRRHYRNCLPWHATRNDHWSIATTTCWSCTMRIAPFTAAAAAATTTKLAVSDCKKDGRFWIFPGTFSYGVRRYCIVCDNIAIDNSFSAVCISRCFYFFLCLFFCCICICLPTQLSMPCEIRPSKTLCCGATIRTNNHSLHEPTWHFTWPFSQNALDLWERTTTITIACRRENDF